MQENLLVLYFGIVYSHINSACLKCVYVNLRCAATDKRAGLLSSSISFSRYQLAVLLLSASPRGQHCLEQSFWQASQNHRMVGVGRDLCGSPSPTPC